MIDRGCDGDLGDLSDDDFDFTGRPVSVACRKSCDTCTAEVEGWYRQWQGAECVQNEAPDRQGNADNCECAEGPQDIETELQPCDTGMYTRTRCDASGTGSVMAMYSDNTCTQPLDGAEETSADGAWQFPGGGSLPMDVCNAVGGNVFTFTCDDDGNGLQTVYEPTDSAVRALPGR